MIEDIDMEWVKSVIPAESKNKFCVIFNSSHVESFDTLDAAINYQFVVNSPTILYLPTDYLDSL